jgi:predicted RNA binding protein YcfA (HicA-like mRNA interferase family)
VRGDAVDGGFTAAALGYVVDRQEGSHDRFTAQPGGQDHEVVPNNAAVKTGTLSGMLKHVAANQLLSVKAFLMNSI